MTILTLTTPVRSTADRAFTEFVDRIREDTSERWQKLKMLSKTFIPSTNAADFLFPEGLLTDAKARAGLEHAFLSPRHIFVDEFDDKFRHLYMEIMVSAIEILHSEK